MKLLDLTLAHVGQWMTLTHTDWTIGGVLEAYDVEHDVMYEQELCALEPVRVLGTKSVRLRVGPWKVLVRDPSRVEVTLVE